MVGMAAPYYRVAAGQVTVQLSARLDQPPPNAVTAIVSVEQRTTDGVSQVGSVSPRSCGWQAGSLTPGCTYIAGAEGGGTYGLTAGLLHTTSHV